jgi:amino acid transporter
MVSDRGDHREAVGQTCTLKRALGLEHLVVYGLVLMTPTAPFGGFGFVYNASHGMVPLVYLIGLVAMFFTAQSYSTMSRAVPLAGSVYAYARAAFGEDVGFLAGWALILDYLLAPTLIYLACAVAIDAVVPGIPLPIWAIGLLALNTAINLRGVEALARANTTLLLLQLFALACFVGAAIWALCHGGAHLSPTPFWNPAQATPGLVLGAVAIGALNYLGFDAISTLAEETRGGVSTVGRATMLALVLSAALFIGQSYLACLFAPDHAQFAPGRPTYAAFYDIAARVGGPWLKTTTSIAGVLMGGAAAALASQAAAARLLFSMARSGWLPTRLAAIRPPHQVPANAILFVTVLTAMLILVFASRLGLLITIVSFGAMSGFLFLHASVLGHHLFKLHSRDWMRHFAAPMVGFAFIALIIWNMNDNAKLVGSGWLIAGALILVSTRKQRRRRRQADPTGVAPSPATSEG